MPPINVTVTWPANAPAPSVDVDPIVVPKGSGATVIRWTSGTRGLGPADHWSAC